MPIGVLVVDDSAVVRGLIARAIGADPAIRVIGSAGDGAAAVAMARSAAPDVVLLDVEMPVMDGLKALPEILAARPGVAVIMASARTQRHAGLSLSALRLGAADYVPKPEAGNDNLPAFFDELIANQSACAKARASRRRPCRRRSYGVCAKRWRSALRRAGPCFAQSVRQGARRD